MKAISIVRLNLASGWTRLIEAYIKTSDWSCCCGDKLMLIWVQRRGRSQDGYRICLRGTSLTLALLIWNLLDCFSTWDLAVDIRPNWRSLSNIHCCACKHFYVSVSSISMIIIQKFFSTTSLHSLILATLQHPSLFGRTCINGLMCILSGLSSSFNFLDTPQTACLSSN